MRDTGTRQISFRCDEATYERIQSERERCNVSLKDFVLQAILQRLDAADQLRGAAPGNVRKKVTIWANPEEETMIKVLFDYIKNVPPKKFDLTLQTLALDAEYYRSARLTGSRFASRFGVNERAALADLPLKGKKSRRSTS